MWNATRRYPIRPQLSPCGDYASFAGRRRFIAGSAGLGSRRQRSLAGRCSLVRFDRYTLLVILPTNKQLLDASLDRSSNLARALLVRWGYLHSVRTVVGLATFVLFVYLIAVGK